jgi:hypothetical protein
VAEEEQTALSTLQAVDSAVVEAEDLGLLLPLQAVVLLLKTNNSLL